MTRRTCRFLQLGPVDRSSQWLLQCFTEQCSVCMCVHVAVSAGLTDLGLACDCCGHLVFSLYCPSLNAIFLFSCTACQALGYIRGLPFIGTVEAGCNKVAYKKVPDIYSKANFWSRPKSFYVTLKICQI